MSFVKKKFLETKMYLRYASRKCPKVCNYTEFEIVTTRATYPNIQYNLQLDNELLSMKGI